MCFLTCVSTNSLFVLHKCCTTQQHKSQWGSFTSASMLTFLLFGDLKIFWSSTHFKSCDGVGNAWQESKQVKKKKEEKKMQGKVAWGHAGWSSGSSVLPYMSWRCVTLIFFRVFYAWKSFPKCLLCSSVMDR